MVKSNNYRLTRYLYPVDEVKYSLITSLLEKKNINECYYWTFELYYSNLEDELFELFYKIHYDFYAEHNPKLESFIKNKKKKWELEKEIIHIASIVKNIFIGSPTPTVFLMRQYICCLGYPSHIYKHNNNIMFGNIINFNSDYKNLCSAICYGRLANIAYDINRLVKKDGADVVHSIIIDYFETELCGICDGGREKINTLWKNREFTDDVHILLAIVVHLMTDINKINFRPLFVIPTQDEINEIILFENNIAVPIYKTLSIKRKYKTRNIIGSFKLARDELPDFINDNLLHWEYYAFGVPLWEKRVNSCFGNVDHNKREICFPDNEDTYSSLEDLCEKFYKQYGYELDEQPSNIQSLSLHEIKPLCWKGWICKLFGLKFYSETEKNKNNISNSELDIDLIVEQISHINISEINTYEVNIKELSIYGNPDIYSELDINSIINNIPNNYRFVY